MRSNRHEMPTSRKPPTLLLAALVAALVLAATAGAAGCAAEEPATAPTSAPSLARLWEFVSYESDGDDLLVMIRVFAPVDLTVLLDGERTPDESSVPEALGIARFRFGDVTPGDHSVKIVDTAGNSISRGVKAGPPPVVAEGADFVLKVGDKARIGEAGPAVAFKGVPQDSRCATDTQCIQAGEAVVALTVDGTDVRVTVPRDGQGAATAAGFAITVSDLEPLPSSTRNIDPEQYRATLRVEAK